MRFQKTQTQSKEKGIKKSPTREINKTQKVAQHIAQQQVMELSSDELEKIVLKDSDDILDPLGEQGTVAGVSRVCLLKSNFLKKRRRPRIFSAPQAREIF